MNGKDLREVRTRLHMSQTEFGLRLGYKQPQIRMSEFERDQRKIPFRVQVVIARVQRYLRGELEAAELPGELLESAPQSVG